MGKKSREKNERQAMAGLVALRNDVQQQGGIRFGVGIEPGNERPILLHFKVGDKTVLPSNWDVPSARAMAKGLTKYCDIAEGKAPLPPA